MGSETAEQARSENRAVQVPYQKKAMIEKAGAVSASERTVLSAMGNRAMLSAIGKDAPPSPAGNDTSSSPTGNAVESSPMNSDAEEVEFSDYSTDYEASAAEQLGLGGKFLRLFSRKVQFQVNGSPITGRNGYQVRGGIIDFMRGSVLDLTPAKLKGRVIREAQEAEGTGAKLLLASMQSRVLQEVTLDHIRLDSRQCIEGKSQHPLEFPMAGKGVFTAKGVWVRKGGCIPSITLEGLVWKGNDGQTMSINGKEAESEKVFELPTMRDAEPEKQLEPEIRQKLEKTMEPKALQELEKQLEPEAEQESEKQAESEEPVSEEPTNSYIQSPSIPLKKLPILQRLQVMTEPELDEMPDFFGRLNQLRVVGKPMQWKSPIRISSGWHFEKAEVSIPFEKGAEKTLQWGAGSTVDKGELPVPPDDSLITLTPMDGYNGLFRPAVPHAKVTDKGDLIIADRALFLDGLPIKPSENKAQNQVQILLQQGKEINFQFKESELNVMIAHSPVILHGNLTYHPADQSIGFRSATLKHKGLADLEVSGANKLRPDGTLAHGYKKEKEEPTAEEKKKEKAREWLPILKKKDKIAELKKEAKEQNPDVKDPKAINKMIRKKAIKLLLTKDESEGKPLPGEVFTKDKAIGFTPKEEPWLETEEGHPKLLAKGVVTLLERPFQFRPGKEELLERLANLDASPRKGMIQAVTPEDEVEGEFVDDTLYNAELPEIKTSFKIEEDDEVGTVTFQGAKISEGKFSAKSMQVTHDDWKRKGDKDEEDEEETDGILAEEKDEDGEEEEEPGLLDTIKSLKDAAHWTQREIYNDIDWSESAESSAALEPSKKDAVPAQNGTGGKDLQYENGYGVIDLNPIEDLSLMYDIDNHQIEAQFTRDIDIDEVSSLFDKASVDLEYPVFPPVTVFFSFAPIFNFGGYGELTAEWNPSETKENSTDLKMGGKVGLKARLGISVAAGVGVSTGIGSLRAQLAMDAMGTVDANVAGDFSINLEKKKLKDKKDKKGKPKSKIQVSLNEVNLNSNLSFALALAVKAQVAARFLIWKKTLCSYTLAAWKTPPLDMKGGVKRGQDGKWRTNTQVKKLADDFKEGSKGNIEKALAKESEGNSKTANDLAAAALRDANANIMIDPKDAQQIAKEVTKIMNAYQLVMEATLQDEETFTKEFAKLTDVKGVYMKAIMTSHRHRDIKRLLDDTQAGKQNEAAQKEPDKQPDAAKTPKEKEKAKSAQISIKDIKAIQKGANGEGRGFEAMFRADTVQERDLPLMKSLFDSHNLTRSKHYAKELMKSSKVGELKPALEELLTKEGSDFYKGWGLLEKSKSKELAALNKSDLNFLRKHIKRQEAFEQVMAQEKGMRVEMLRAYKEEDVSNQSGEIVLLSKGLRDQVLRNTNMVDLDKFYQFNEEEEKAATALVNEICNNRVNPMIAKLDEVRKRRDFAKDMIRKSEKVLSHCGDKPAQQNAGTPLVSSKSNDDLMLTLADLFSTIQAADDGTMKSEMIDAENTGKQVLALSTELQQGLEEEKARAAQ